MFNEDASTRSSKRSVVGGDSGCNEPPGDDESMKEVVLNFEAMKDSHARVLLWCQRCSTVLSLIALFVLLHTKIVVDYEDVYLAPPFLQIANICVGCICSILLLAATLMMAIRLWNIKKAKARWSPRRRRIFRVASCIVVLSFLSSMTYVAANVNLLPKCSVLYKFKANAFYYAAQSLLLNTVVILYVVQAHEKAPLSGSLMMWIHQALRRLWLSHSTAKPEKDSSIEDNQPKQDNRLVMDVKPWLHTPKLLIWLFAQAMVISTSINIVTRTTAFTNVGDSFVQGTCTLSQELYPIFDELFRVSCPDPADEDVTWDHDNDAFLTNGTFLSAYDGYCTSKPSLSKTMCSADDTLDLVNLWQAGVTIGLTMMFIASPTDNFTFSFVCERSCDMCDIMLPHAEVVDQMLDPFLQSTQEFISSSSLTDEDRELIVGGLMGFLEDPNGTMIGTISAKEMSRVLGNVLRVTGTFGGSDDFLTVILQIGILVLCFVLYVVYIWGAIRSLQSKPYNHFRTGNVLIRWEVRTMLLLFCVMNLSWMLLWFVENDDVATTWAGSLGVWMPLQIAGTWVAFEIAILYQPKLHDELLNPLQEDLQQFMWIDPKVAKTTTEERRLGMGVDKIGLFEEPGQHQPTLQRCPTLKLRGPQFYFDRALRAWLWSKLAYSVHRGDEKEVDLAMRVLSCTQYKKIRHERLDVCATIFWGPRNIVVSFRGTDSMRNAITDAQAWMNGIDLSFAQARSTLAKVFEPKNVWNWISNPPPKVHKGFWTCWTAIKGMVVEALDNILAEMVPGDGIDVMVTGHSLGGAIAVIAAADIRTLLEDYGLHDADLYCYTLGAPRVGNTSFANLCNHRVPDTWHIINGKDMVPRMDPLTKLLIRYKRTGHQVFVNSRGDLIVRPSFAERTLLVPPILTLRNVNDHMLAPYAASMLAIINAQFEGKGFPNGAYGAQSILDDPLLGELVDYMAHMANPGRAQEDEDADEDADEDEDEEKPLATSSTQHPSKTLNDVHDDEGGGGDVVESGVVDQQLQAPSRLRLYRERIWRRLMRNYGDEVYKG